MYAFCAAAVATDRLNNVYFTMTYEHPFTFDTFSLSPIVGPSGESRDVFVAKMAPNGHPLWLKSIGGGLDEYAGDITVDTFQNIFTTGYFASTDCHFDSIVLSSLLAGYSVYTAKIGPAINHDVVQFTATDTTICQNSSITSQRPVNRFAYRVELELYRWNSPHFYPTKPNGYL